MGSARFSECRELFVGTRRCQEQLSTTSLPPQPPPPDPHTPENIVSTASGRRRRRRARAAAGTSVRATVLLGLFRGGMRGPEKNWRLRFAPFNKCPPQKTVSLVKKQNNMMHSLNGEAIACRYCSVVENLPVRIATRESRYRIPA